MRVGLWRSETPEEARRRRLCRQILGLPPEPEYRHVLPGVATLGGLGALLIGVVAWRLGHLGTLARVLIGTLALAAPVLQFRRRYRHVAAGALVLAVWLGLLAAVVHRHGYLAPLTVSASQTGSSLAQSTATR